MEGSRSERRRTARFLSAHPIDIGDQQGAECDPARSEEAFLAAISGARTLDVSESGCRLVSDTPLPKGARLRFELRLQDVDYGFQGRIAWVRRSGKQWEAGVEFLDLDEMDRDGIRLFLIEEGAPPAPGSDPDSHP
jgi:hypothetical protein